MVRDETLDDLPAFPAWRYLSLLFLADFRYLYIGDVLSACRMILKSIIKKENPDPNYIVRVRIFVVELKAAKTHTVLYQINRTEYYCQVDLPLSDYPLYGKQLVASLKQY